MGRGKYGLAEVYGRRDLNENADDDGAVEMR